MDEKVGPDAHIIHSLSLPPKAREAQDKRGAARPDLDKC